MRDDHRFDRYLTVRARGIELPPASITSVIDRAARRHRHRRAAVSACTAVAVLTAAVSVANLDGSPSTEQVVARPAGGILVDSSLAWTTVAPKSGLSWSHSTVFGPGNAIYSLSTAPGSVQDDQGSSPAVLYRSADGVEWTPIELPSNLNASSLATTDHTLYAIGTAPAGGNLRAVQLASTANGGTWSKATLPLDVGALETRYGVKIGMGRLSVASDGTRVLVAARLQAVDGIERHLPSTIDTSGGFQVSERGIDVYSKVDVETAKGSPPLDKREAVTRVAPTVSASFTWQELGIDDSLRSLILGETRLFVADDGRTFIESKLPTTVRYFGAVFATTGGFRIYGSTDISVSRFDAWRSIDGHEWTADVSGATAGYLLASGLREGRVALVSAVDRAGSSNQDVFVKMEQPDGTWSDFEVNDLLRRAGLEGEFYPSSAAAVGPLGVALVVSEQRSDDTQRSYLVTTADGIEASIIDLNPLLEGGYPGDVRVGADAISVTVSGPAMNGPVRLVVGTPKR